jgi:hypothetical protein
MNRAPKYSKIELLLRKKGVSLDPIIEQVEKLEFLDCGLMITGDYIVVIIDEKDELNGSQTSTGKIYPISTVSAYKTYTT